MHTPRTASSLVDHALHRRAVEAVNWGMPSVNFELMYQAAVRAGAGFGQIVYWSRPSTWKNQTLTPNPDVIYAMPFFNTKEVGPVVLEIPPADDGSITGSIMDCWQDALEDVGPAGVDRGRGGKYVILPPGFHGKVFDGAIALPSTTYEGYALLRSILRDGSDEDIVRAVAYAKRIKLYPVAQASSPPPTRFVDVVDRVFDATIPYDLRFYEALDRIVQVEPWQSRDKVMIDMLKSIGIEKGKRFAPDAHAQEILEDAVGEAHAWIDVRYETAFQPFYPNAHWTLPAVQDYLDTMPTFFEKPDAYVVDARGLEYFVAFSSVKHLGAGQFYLWTLYDRAGQSLDGARMYRLVVPPNVPAKQYWSVVLYDRATHGLIRDVDRASRSSLAPELRRERDGSVELYFGPAAPNGKTSNWIPTHVGGRFEVLFRLYGPERPLFDKSWRLSDIEPLTD